MINHLLQSGQEIAKANQIRRIDDHAYKVKSQSDKGIEYDVLSTN
jgi:hypothetical protein